MNSELGLRKIRISIAVVFYNPSIEDVQRTLRNIKLLKSIEFYDFSFYLIDNASPDQRLLPLLPKRMESGVYYKGLKKMKALGLDIILL